MSDIQVACPHGCLLLNSQIPVQLHHSRPLALSAEFLENLLAAWPPPGRGSAPGSVLRMTTGFTCSALGERPQMPWERRRTSLSCSLQV